MRARGLLLDVYFNMRTILGREIKKNQRLRRTQAQMFLRESYNVARLPPPAPHDALPYLNQRCDGGGEHVAAAVCGGLAR